MDDHRLRAEHDGLKRLEEAAAGILSVVATPNLRHFDVTVRVPAPVGHDQQYTVEREHRLAIDLPDDFPASGPVCAFEQPIFAPNIWPNGSACIAESDWMPGQHLDNIVCDIIEEMQGLKPNYGSIANEVAGRAYLRSAFLTELRRKLGEPVRLAPPPWPTEQSPLNQPRGIRSALGPQGGIETLQVDKPPEGRTIRTINSR